MTVQPHRQARALVVTSSSPAELGLAIAFLRGQEFTGRARMLIPQALCSGDQSDLPAPGSPYVTLDDILGTVDAYQPDLVCFFSAYLICFDRLLSPRALDLLLSRLRDRGCRIVTSDPFLGLASRVTYSEIDTRMLMPGRAAWRRRLLTFVLSRRPGMKVLGVPGLAAPGLADLIHLYPTSVPDARDGIRRVSFFNPSIARVAGDGPVPPGGPDRHDPRPRWLFLLSAAELHVQRVLVGLREFIECLLGMLRHALEAGTRPTLIAPSWILHRLAGAVPDVELVPACPFGEFERRALDAEYVFSWNMFSFSHLARVANDLPIFFFDRGYFARTFAPYYQIARSCHLGGWEPTCLDQRQLFSPYVLAHLAKTQKPEIRALRERWQLSPPPDALVDKLLSGVIES